MFLFKKLVFWLFLVVCIFDPSFAHAGKTLVDALDLSPFVPLILDALMMVATGTYEFFVGNGDGIIYVFIWLFLGFSIGMYLVKMYIPKNVLGFVGMSGGGEMWDGKAKPQTIAENILRPAIRAMVAAILLLQIKPVFVTQWLVNPFLQFGSLYTRAIISTINESGVVNPDKVKCPADIVEKAWISEPACEFLTQPIADLSYANNQIIKRGFQFITNGLRGLMTLVPHGGENFLNIISGIFIVFTFVGCNLFMAFLIIQAIFNLGVALMLYPFNVLVWTVKPSDKWFDPLPVFSNIIKALQDIIITMIACAFILGLNVALIKALFQWNTSVFVVAAGGTATANVPTVANSAMGFGQHSIFWLSAILTFYVMQRMFDVTREQLNSYTKGMDGLYKQVKGDAKTTFSNVKKTGKAIGTAIGWIKDKK